jgi:hypothetical protein
MDFGRGNYSNEPSLMSKEFQHEEELKNLIENWKVLVLNYDYEKLEKIDLQARSLAWEIYKSPYIDSDRTVFKLFKYCQYAQRIGRGLMAAKVLNEKDRLDSDYIEMLCDRLVDGANALDKHYFVDPELESIFLKIWNKYYRKGRRKK